MAGTSKKRTRIHFREGFTYNGVDYGWCSGELYQLSGEVFKLKIWGKGRGRVRYYKMGDETVKVPEAFKMTVPIDFRHVDTERNVYAYRPAFSKKGFGFAPGTPWEQMRGIKFGKK